MKMTIMLLQRIQLPFRKRIPGLAAYRGMRIAGMHLPFSGDGMVVEAARPGGAEQKKEKK
ncbi:hypothetical protein AGMMS49925_03920 [Deltaproteobacteria bacterium]|nr:hypothetical protein AGMMS49925_03920 [Deltaproteobacteria bacterium]